MLNISNAEEAVLTAEAKMAKWQQTFLTQWYAPQLKADFMRATAGITAEQRNLMLDQMQVPAELKRLLTE